jgi:hypothetical protein
MGAFDPLVRTGDFQEVWRLILTDPAFRVRRRSSSDEVTEAAAVPRHPAQNPVYSAPRTLNDDTEPAQRLSVLAPAIEALREDVASGAWQRWTSEDSEAEERFQKVERVLGLLALLQEVPHRSSASTRLHHFDQQFCDENEAETREEQIKEPPLMDFNFISTLRWVFIHEPIYFIDAAVASGFAYSIYVIYVLSGPPSSSAGFLLMAGVLYFLPIRLRLRRGRRLGRFLKRQGPYDKDMQQTLAKDAAFCFLGVSCIFLREKEGDYIAILGILGKIT